MTKNLDRLKALRIGDHAVFLQKQIENKSLVSLLPNYRPTAPTATMMNLRSSPAQFPCLQCSHTSLCLASDGKAWLGTLKLNVSTCTWKHASVR